MTLPTSITEGITGSHDNHHVEIHTKVNNLEVSGSNVGIGVGTPTKLLDVASTSAAAQIKSTSATNNNHALTAWQAGNDSALTNAVALNATSDNEYSSTAYIDGLQRDRGTLKITHTKPSVADSSAAALSIDLVGSGTAARGLAIITTTATTGDPILVRNNGRDDFVVKGTGRVGIGISTAATPQGMVDIRPYDTATKGLFIQAFASGGLLVEIRDSAAATQLDVDNAGRIRWALAPRWNAAGIEQTTVGTAGGASAPPATPTKYLKVVDSAGTTLVIPAYAAA